MIDKKVETMIDFDNEIGTIYKITRDKKHIKKKIDEEEVVRIVKNIRYGQQTYERTDEQVGERDWKMSIAEIKLNGVATIHGIIQVQTEISTQEWVQPFSEDTAASIEEMKACAATDASVKDGKMGGCWIIGNNVNKDVLSREMCHKR